MRSQLFLLAFLFAASGVPAAPSSQGPVKLTASLAPADHARRVFKTCSDHYVDGALVIPAHSLVYTTDADASGARQIARVWIGHNWTPGFVSFRAANQRAAGTVTPTSDRYTFTARFTRLPVCYVTAK